ncbi:hypothetical protein BH23VER1_BH23VER1_32030 [soil metagenome]
MASYSNDKVADAFEGVVSLTLTVSVGVVSRGACSAPPRNGTLITKAKKATCPRYVALVDFMIPRALTSRFQMPSRIPGDTLPRIRPKIHSYRTRALRGGCAALRPLARRGSYRVPPHEEAADRGRPCSRPPGPGRPGGRGSRTRSAGAGRRSPVAGGDGVGVGVGGEPGRHEAVVGVPRVDEVLWRPFRPPLLSSPVSQGWVPWALFCRVFNPMNPPEPGLQPAVSSSPTSSSPPRGTLCAAPYARNPMRGTLCAEPYARHPMRGTRCAAPDARHPMERVLYPPVRLADDGYGRRGR